MTTQNTQESEVARIRAAIALEQEAAERALRGPAMVSRHAFIEAKQQRIGEHFLALSAIVGDEQTAIAIVADTLASVDVGGCHASR